MKKKRQKKTRNDVYNESLIRCIFQILQLNTGTINRFDHRIILMTFSLFILDVVLLKQQMTTIGKTKLLSACKTIVMH